MVVHHTRYYTISSHRSLQDHLLVLGGCGGPNNEYPDIWLLRVDGAGAGWEWREMRVLGAEHRARDIWCHPGCRVGDRVVVLGRDRHPPAPPTNSQPARPGPGPSSRQPPRPRHGRLSAPAPHHSESSDSEVELAVLPARSSFCSTASLNIAPSPAAPPAEPAPDMMPVRVTPAHAKAFGPAANTGTADPGRAGTNAASLAAGAPQKNRQKMLESRQRQLASLQRMEERIRVGGAAGRPASSSAPLHCPHHTMSTFILDISRCLSHGEVEWLEQGPASRIQAPTESILYSLVLGRTELIMFGGLQKDVSIGAGRGAGQTSDTVSNDLYFLNPPQLSI